MASLSDHGALFSAEGPAGKPQVRQLDDFLRSTSLAASRTAARLDRAPRLHNVGSEAYGPRFGRAVAPDHCPVAVEGYRPTGPPKTGPVRRRVHPATMPTGRTADARAALQRGADQRRAEGGGGRSEDRDLS